jgi:phosphatidylglycerophosphate synthase
MSVWLFWLLYAGGFVFTYRHAYLALASDDMVGASDTTERAMAASLAMISCTMWPLMLVGYVVWRFITPVTPAQREAELDARQREIERMERNLGINPRP